MDGLAEEVGKIVLDKELKFLQGTFGICIVIGFKYVIWPLLKKYGGRKMRKCKYDFFNKKKYLFLYFYYLPFHIL